MPSSPPLPPVSEEYLPPSDFSIQTGFSPPDSPPMSGGAQTNHVAPPAPANINVFNIGGGESQNNSSDPPKTSSSGDDQSTNEEKKNDSNPEGNNDSTQTGGTNIKFYKLTHDQGLDAAKTLELEPDNVIKSGDNNNNNEGEKKIIF